MASSKSRCCPQCGSYYLRLSRSGVLRHVAWLVFLHPVRCTSCRCRIWRFGLRPPRSRREKTDRVATATAPPQP